MTPRARTTGLDVADHDGGLRIRDRATDSEHILHPLTAFVWKHADGDTRVEDLAARATAAFNSPVTEDHVWAAIDVLTGARLLEDRIAPPAGAQRLARRDLLRTVAVGSAAAAAVGAVALPAHAQSSSEVRGKQAAEQQAKEAQNKVAKENEQKFREKQEDAAKQQHQEQVAKQHARESDAKSQHEEASKSAREEASKNQNPYTEVILEADWAHFGEGFAPLAWERRGPHVHLIGLVEFTGEPDLTTPPEPDIIPCVEPDPTAQPPDPDHDQFDQETILIGRLPEGARPPATLCFAVASDTLIGSSEVQITADGEILLVLEDENDDQLDDALDAAGDPPGEIGAKLLETDQQKEVDPRQTARCLRRKLLRKRRRHLRMKRARQRRLLRKRAKLARRRCSDGKEVFLTGPSEISLAGISFRVLP